MHPGRWKVTLEKVLDLRIRRRRALAAFALPAAALVIPSLGPTTAFAAPSSNQDDQGRRGDFGFVYTNLNTAPMNTVAGFARHANGTLRPLPGSPFTVGGVGAGATVGSQGALQAARGGRFLLVANAASNNISVVAVDDDGSLRPVAGSPFSSNGTMPVSIAVHDDLVYVANAGDGGANYTGFRLGENGQLKPLAGSTVSVPDGSSLGDVLFNGTGTILVGARVTYQKPGSSTAGAIDSFRVGSNGLLSAAPGSPYAAPIDGPLGSAFRTTNSWQLFVTLAHGGPDKGAVQAYSVTRDGVLTPIGAPVGVNQTATCWGAVLPNGRYFYAANAGSDSISVLSIAPDGSLTDEGYTTLKGGPGLGTFDIGIDPAGRTLYVVDTAKGEISVGAIKGDSLVELKSSPVGLPTGVHPFGIVVI